MKKRYLETVESVLALKDTETKIYEERSKRNGRCKMKTLVRYELDINTLLKKE